MPIGLVDKPKESCTGTRWSETCVAPRHVGVTCFRCLISFFVLFLLRTVPYQQRGGVAGALPDFLFLFIFPLLLMSKSQAGLATV